MPLPKSFTTHDVARMLQVDPSSIGKWMDKGTLIGFKTPGGHRRIQEAELRRFIAQYQMPLPDELATGAAATDSANGASTEPAAVAAPRRIERGTSGGLLVLDDVYWVEKTTRAVRKSFPNARVTTSPLEAMLVLAEERPEFFLVELNLKAPRGLDVVTQVKTWPSLKGVRVVTMTGLYTPIAVKRSLAAGAETCLKKPLDGSELSDAFQLARSA